MEIFLLWLLPLIAVDAEIDKVQSQAEAERYAIEAYVTNVETDLLEQLETQDDINELFVESVEDVQSDAAKMEETIKRLESIIRIMVPRLEQSIARTAQLEKDMLRLQGFVAADIARSKTVDAQIIKQLEFMQKEWSIVVETPANND